MPEATAGEQRVEPVLKKVDAWWTVLLVDPLAVRLVSAIRRFERVTPTGLTVVAHLLGAVSAALFLGDRLVLAAVLFEVRFVLDCADGKLARVRGTSSAAGAFLDYVGDYLVVGANLVALAVHVAWTGDDPPVALAVLLPAAFLAHICAEQARQLEVRESGRSSQPPVERLPGGYRAWMAERRLRSTPGRVDAEHVLLFVMPIVAVGFDRPGLLQGAVGLASAYFTYRTLRISVGGYRIAAARDRAGT